MYGAKKWENYDNLFCQNYWNEISLNWRFANFLKQLSNPHLKMFN